MKSFFSFPRRTMGAETPHHTPVAVLGAGLAGMSAAITLKESSLGFRIFEKLDRAGGHAVTNEDSGYRFDRTGHLLHLRDDEMRQRVLDWIGNDHNVVQRRSVIWSNSVYTRYPFQANTFGLPPSVAKECLLGFIEAHFAKDPPTPENFEEFCNVHFGAGISKHFMIPYNSRLWGVPPSEITSAWCQRFVPLPRLEDVVAGAVGSNEIELGYNANFVYPRKGIGVLSAAMANELPEIELERAPRRLDHEKKELHFEDEVVRYEHLVSTLPMPVLVELMQNPPAEVVSAVKRLRCTHLYYLDVALDTACGQPVHWIYVPEAKYPFYRVGCYSHFSEEMAPPGKAALYVELADRSEPNLGALLPRVASALVEMQIIGSASDIAFARLRKIDWAYVVFDHSYYEAVETLRSFFASAGIESVGRYGQWTYCSMEDALVYGRSAARKIAEGTAP